MGEEPPVVLERPATVWGWPLRSSRPETLLPARRSGLVAGRTSGAPSFSAPPVALPEKAMLSPVQVPGVVRVMSSPEFWPARKMTEVAGLLSPIGPFTVSEAPSWTPMRVLVVARVIAPDQVLWPARLWSAPRWMAGVGVVTIFWPVPERLRVCVSPKTRPPVRARVASAATAALVPRAAAFCAMRMPVLTAQGPVKVLAPVRVRMPLPDLARPPSGEAGSVLRAWATVMLKVEVSRVRPPDLTKALLRPSRKVVDEAVARRVPPLKFTVPPPEPLRAMPLVVRVAAFRWTVPLPPEAKRKARRPMLALPPLRWTMPVPWPETPSWSSSLLKEPPSRVRVPVLPEPLPTTSGEAAPTVESEPPLMVMAPLPALPLPMTRPRSGGRRTVVPRVAS
jgi:hypothetical protein